MADLDPVAPDRDARLAQSRAAMQAGRAAEAVPVLEALHQDTPDDAEVGLVLAVALRMEQRLVEAEALLAQLAEEHPDHAAILEGLAQTRFELGLPAAILFAQASALRPHEPDLIRNRAAAMAAEGDVAGAEALLEAALAQSPAWLEGHKALATLRWTHSDPARFAESYRQACAARPAEEGLWLAWFRALAQTRDWAGCSAILGKAETALGNRVALEVCRLFLAVESGDVPEADALLARLSDVQGETVLLCRIRHAIRQRRLDAAEQAIIPHLLSPSATMLWPYLSIIWRLKGDARAAWIDRPDDLIRMVDVGLSRAELDELAEVLRALHTMQRPYVEQSVRGGTQTDRSVILRHEPILRRARAHWIEAIRGYVAGLPPFEQGHPLLGTPRGALLVEGSWSVRLVRQGYNVPHTHPMGWLSTAFYIALPAPEAMGPAPAGHIQFGVAPADLGIDLPPYRTLAPQVGHSAVFPSTMWHGTVPFDDGERLVMALDIRTPRS